MKRAHAPLQTLLTLSLILGHAGAQSAAEPVNTQTATAETQNVVEKTQGGSIIELPWSTPGAELAWVSISGVKTRDEIQAVYISAAGERTPLQVQQNGPLQQILLQGPQAQGGRIELELGETQASSEISLSVLRDGLIETLLGKTHAAPQAKAAQVTPQREGLIRNIQDGQVVRGAASTRVVVESAYGKSASLSVRYADGSERIIPNTQIGLQTDDAAKNLTRREYIGVPLRVGKNTIEVRLSSNGSEDQEGESEVLKDQVKIILAGPGQRAQLRPLQNVADGHSPIEIEVTALDAQGRRTILPNITVYSTGIIGADADPQQSGYQLALTDGQGVLRLSPMSRSSDLTVDLNVNGQVQSETVEIRRAQNKLVVISTEATLDETGLSANAKVSAEVPIDSGQLTLVASTKPQNSGAHLKLGEAPERYQDLGDASQGRAPLQSIGPVAFDLDHPNIRAQYSAGAMQDPLTKRPAAGDALSMRTKDLNPSRATTEVALEYAPGAGSETTVELTVSAGRVAQIQNAEINSGIRIMRRTYDGDILIREDTLSRGLDYAISDSGLITFAQTERGFDEQGRRVRLYAIIPQDRGGAPQATLAVIHKEEQQDETGQSNTQAVAGISLLPEQNSVTPVFGVRAQHSRVNTNKTSSAMQYQSEIVGFASPETGAWLFGAKASLNWPAAQQSTKEAKDLSAQQRALIKEGVELNLKFHHESGEIKVPERTGMNSVAAEISAPLKQDQTSQFKVLGNISAQQPSGTGLMTGAPVGIRIAEGAEYTQLTENGQWGVSFGLGHTRAETGQEWSTEILGAANFSNQDWQAQTRVRQKLTQNQGDFGVKLTRSLKGIGPFQDLNINVSNLTQWSEGEVTSVSNLNAEGRQGPWKLRAFYETPTANWMSISEAGHKFGTGVSLNIPIKLSAQWPAQAALNVSADAAASHVTGTGLQIVGSAGTVYRDERTNAALTIGAAASPAQDEASFSVQSSFSRRFSSASASAPEDEQSLQFSGLSLWQKNATGRSAGHRYTLSYAERGEQSLTAAYGRWTQGSFISNAKDLPGSNFEAEASHTTYGPNEQHRNWLGANVESTDPSGWQINAGHSSIFWLGKAQQEKKPASSAAQGLPERSNKKDVLERIGLGLKGSATAQPAQGRASAQISPELSFKLMPGVIISAGYPVISGSWAGGQWQNLPKGPYLHLSMDLINLNPATPQPPTKEQQP